MGIPIDEAEFEDADEVTPDVLEDVVVQTSSNGWQLANIHVDQPTADGVLKRRAGLRRRDQTKDILLYFLYLLSMKHFGVVYSAMQLKSHQIAKEVETAKWVNIDQGLFAKFLKICVCMALYCLPYRDYYWREG